jgi:hypothetical protein
VPDFNKVTPGAGLKMIAGKTALLGLLPVGASIDIDGDKKIMPYASLKAVTRDETVHDHFYYLAPTVDALLQSHEAQKVERDRIYHALHFASAAIVTALQKSEVLDGKHPASVALLKAMHDIQFGE